MPEPKDMTPREQEMYKALRSIANLYPYPPFCASLAVHGINDGKSRAILLDAALEISRKAVAAINGEAYEHPKLEQ